MKRPTTHVRTPRSLTESTLAAIAHRLAMGHPMYQIAENLSISQDAVKRAQKILHKRWASAVVDYEHEMSLAYARYNDLIATGYSKGQLRLVLDAQNSLVKLLGLARPEKADVSLSGGIGVDLRITYDEAPAPDLTNAPDLEPGAPDP